MSTVNDTRDGAEKEITTASIDRETLETLNKLKNGDEKQHETVRAAVKALAKRDPDRLKVTL